MDPFIDPNQYDLATPDGVITSLTHTSETTADCIVFIQNISNKFVGFQIDPAHIYFNIKSTLAQLGLDGIGQAFELDIKNQCVQVKVKLTAFGPLGIAILKLLEVGSFIGKLFAADERRRVRDPDYISRMFGRSDRWGKPLLSLGGLQGGTDLILEKLEGRTVAYLTLLNGKVEYDSSIYGFLPTLSKALVKGSKMRDVIRLHQEWKAVATKNVQENDILLVKTLPLHIRTVFAKVVDRLLPPGYHHTSANVLQPDTLASGDIYELWGKSNRDISDIPIEFYTLEPYREHVFFADRDQLQVSLEDNKSLYQAFKTAPPPP